MSTAMIGLAGSSQIADNELTGCARNRLLAGTGAMLHTVFGIKQPVVKTETG